MFQRFLGPFRVQSGRNALEAPVLQVQAEIIIRREIGIGVVVDDESIDNPVDRNPFVLVHEDAFLPVKEDGAVGLVGPGGIDDDLVVRFPGEGRGLPFRSRFLVFVGFRENLRLPFFQDNQIADTDDHA